MNTTHRALLFILAPLLFFFGKALFSETKENKASHALRGQSLTRQVATAELESAKVEEPIVKKSDVAGGTGEIQEPGDEVDGPVDEKAANKSATLFDSEGNDLPFEALVKKPELVEQFLQGKVLSQLEDWNQYPPYETKKFESGDMIGRFESVIDQGKGRIVITIGGAPRGKSFAGRVAVNLFDKENNPVVKSVTLTEEVGDKLRIDKGSQGLLLRQHSHHHFVVQIFRGTSDELIIGNIYEWDGAAGLALYGTFKATKGEPLK